MITNKLLTTMFLVVISLGAFGQRNHQLVYLKEVQQANSHFENKMYANAIVHFNAAFEEVKFIPRNDLKRAIASAKKEGNDSLVDAYKALLLRNDDDINKVYQKAIDSLMKIDQKTRHGKYYKANRYWIKCRDNPEMEIDSVKYQKSLKLLYEWEKTDSSNISTLLKLIERYGFPSARQLGAKLHFSANTLLLHFDKDTANHILQPILDSALFHGDIRPKEYAYIIDRHLLNAGRDQKYYVYLPYFFQALPEDKKELVLESRRQIGIFRFNYKYGSKSYTEE